MMPCHLLISLSLWNHRIYVKVCYYAYFNFWEILTLIYIFAHNSKLILPQRASSAGVGSQIFVFCCFTKPSTALETGNG